MLLLTVGLIVVGFVLLAVGLVVDVLPLVWGAIGCAMVAGLVLLAYSRVSRRQAVPAGAAPAAAAGAPPPAWAPPPATSSYQPAPAPAWTPPPPPPEPTATLGTVPSERGPDTEVVAPVAVAAGSSVDQEMEFPIADYDELRVSEILPLLPELDLDELDVVRERELAGKRRLAVIDRIDDLMDELEAEEVPVAVSSAPVPSARVPSRDGYPIADYETRSVDEIVAIIPDLSDDELDLLAELEEQGQNRAAVLDAIDDQFEEVEITDEELVVPAPLVAVKKAPAKRAPVKKAPARRAPVKRAPVTRAPVKKVAVKAARKGPVKKLGVKRAPAQRVAVKATATRATAKRAPVKRASVKKAPVKRATVTRVVKKVGRPAKKR